MMEAGRCAQTLVITSREPARSARAPLGNTGSPRALGARNDG